GNGYNVYGSVWKRKLARDVLSMPSTDHNTSIYVKGMGTSIFQCPARGNLSWKKSYGTMHSPGSGSRWGVIDFGKYQNRKPCNIRQLRFASHHLDKFALMIDSTSGLFYYPDVDVAKHRHRGVPNVLFLDGHVKGFKSSQK